MPTFAPRTAELEERNREVLTEQNKSASFRGKSLRIQDEERRHIARELHDSADKILLF